MERDVQVNVFRGFETQNPMIFDIKARYYQDIVTKLIHEGLPSGEIRTINGDEINYNEPIEVDEVNYILPTGRTKNINIYSENGDKYVVNFNLKGKIRDIYNQAVALSFPIDSYVIIGDKTGYLDDNEKSKYKGKIKIVTYLPKDRTFEGFDEMHLLRFPWNSDFIDWVMKLSSINDIPFYEVDTQSDYFKVYIGRGDAIEGDWKHFDKNIIEDVNNSIEEYGYKIYSKSKGGYRFLFWADKNDMKKNGNDLDKYIETYVHECLKYLNEDIIGNTHARIAWSCLCLMYFFDTPISQPGILNDISRAWRYSQQIYQIIHSNQSLKNIYESIEAGISTLNLPLGE